MFITALAGDPDDLLSDTHTWLNGSELRHGVAYLVAPGSQLEFGAWNCTMLELSSCDHAWALPSTDLQYLPASGSPLHTGSQQAVSLGCVPCAQEFAQWLCAGNQEQQYTLQFEEVGSASPAMEMLMKVHCRY